MHKNEKTALGWPGIDATWTSGAKSGVGTSLNSSSKVWYSISHGILNEIYYPQVDQACTKDLSIIITDGKEFFSEEKHHTTHHIKPIANGVPGYIITNSCKSNHYQIEKEIITDPFRDTLLIHIKFSPTNKKRKDLKLFMLLAPHLGNLGSRNTAWVGNYKGLPMLFAQRKDTSLALACSVPWKKRSAGFVGTSDGWQDLMLHKEMLWEFECAENGNVALTGEFDLQGTDDKCFTIALGFGRNADEAGQRARASIFEGFESAKKHFIREWQGWLKKLDTPNVRQKDSLPKFFNVSAAMLKTHESKRHPGALIASLSIPWGYSKGDDDLGGYHLVWPRDMVQAAGGLLAANAFDEAKRVLNYLMVTQEEDGHWTQNMWLNGTPYWHGIQMDQTALPIMLVDLVHREINFSDSNLRHFWPMIRKAACYLVKNGPTSKQDRWEENAGYSTYTLAAEISALLISAEYAELNSEPQVATYLRETADSWNSSIENWTYVKGSDLAKFVGVDGYYVRINSHQSTVEQKGIDTLTISNRPKGENTCPINEMVSPDALALVRFGLRPANDPHIVNTIKVIDATLKFNSPGGPAWYRYNRDGYGEHADGQPFNGTGIGRPWPLLTGERAHYEIAAGNYTYANKLIKAFESYANEIGLFPEQIWDSEDIPELGLYKGKATGGACPLVWAHSEYLKLCRSIKSKKIFDMPPQTRQRYLIQKTTSNIFIWDFDNPYNYIPQGKILRIQCLTPAKIHWTSDNWTTIHDTLTLDSGIGIHYADLPTAALTPAQSVIYTFYWQDAKKWENKNFSLPVEAISDTSDSKIRSKKHPPERDKIKVFLPS